MAIDKEYWKKLSLSERNLPEIVCPTCCKGHLHYKKDHLVKKETKVSEADRRNDDWEPFWIRYNFSALLKCNNLKCGEAVTCLGDGRVEEDMLYDEVKDYWESIYYDIFYPVYFYSSLHIISISESYHKELADKLIDSFSHFFSDLTSCANKIRGCIEILMDKLNINKTKIVSGKRKDLTLHARILLYKTQNPAVADYLLAIKWIGNFGSHLEDLTKDDILDAYQILDFSLRKIYDKETKEIIKLSKEINKRKAPRSTKKQKNDDLTF
jgi:hypothetical protein